MLAGPPLQRGHAPGDRGQGGRGDQGREPDPRHDHPAELLPPLRQALRHDRHGHDRGRRVPPDLQARRGADPDQPADGPHRPGRPRLPDRGGQVRRGRRRHRRAARRRASRCWSAPTRSRSPSTSPSMLRQARGPARGAQRQAPRARGRDRRRRPAARARSPSPPTWPAAAPTSCSAATPSSCADAELRERGPRPGRDARGVRGGLGRGARRRPRQAVAAEHEEVIELGGLYVLGTERHESRRIDNQLRGRSGRQGDPGESRFYLSLEDDLMRLFNAGAGRAGHDPAKHRRTTCRSRPRWSPARSRARRRQVEPQNFEIRKNVLKYDEVLNRQRKVIYAERRRVLEGEDLHEQIRALHRRRRRRLRRRRDRRGLRRGLGPRAAVDGAARRSTRSRSRPRRSSEAAGGRGDLTADAARARSCSPTPSHAYDAREEAARRARSCASWSAGSCSRCSTASGASTSTRWTTSRRASACARWPSATRWSSTSARASTCSRR